MTEKTSEPRRGESMLHKQAKSEIAAALNQDSTVDDVVIERSLSGVRADVSALIRGKMVAIEVQCSQIRVEDIRRRTEIFAALGIYVLWVCPADVTAIDMVAPKEFVWFSAWQKFIYAMYGHLPIWTGGQTVVAADLSRRRWQWRGGGWQPDFRVPHLGAPESISALSAEDRQLWLKTAEARAEWPYRNVEATQTGPGNSQSQPPPAKLWCLNPQPPPPKLPRQSRRKKNADEENVDTI